MEIIFGAIVAMVMAYLFFFFLSKTVIDFLCLLFYGSDKSDEQLQQSIDDMQEAIEELQYNIKPTVSSIKTSDNDIAVQASYDEDMHVLTLIIRLPSKHGEDIV